MDPDTADDASLERSHYEMEAPDVYFHNDEAINS